MEDPDFELLQAWRDGDQAAGSALFERHFAGLYRFFRNKVGFEADDLLQQTFLSCVKARDDFRGASSFRTYLFTIARSRLYDHLRRSQARPDMDFGTVSVEDLQSSPTAQIAKGERNRMLLTALRQLPVDLQLVLELYYFERIRGSELVEIMGLPAGTVRSKIRRGVERLRANLERLDVGDEEVTTTLSGLDEWATKLRDGFLKPGADKER